MQSITLEELKQKLELGGLFCLIEVSPKESYEEYHLPQAMNVPFDAEFASKVQQTLPNQDEEIVVYSSDADSKVSFMAAQKLTELGYRRVRHLYEGKVGWRAEGLGGDSSPDEARSA